MTVEEEVRAFNDAYERALAEQDVDALVSLHTDDARLMMAGRPVVQGRPAIEKVLREWLSEGPVSTRSSRRKSWRTAPTSDGAATD